MFCGNCGANNAEGTRFCANCGAPLQPAQPAYQQQPVQANYAQQQPAYQQPVQGGYTQQQYTYQQPAQNGYAQQSAYQYAQTGYQATDAQYQQQMYYEQPKKSKKGLIIGLICGGVALIAAVAVVLCLWLCGSSWALEPGMSEAEVKEAMLDEGFKLEITRNGDREYGIVGVEYSGNIEGIGKANVSCIFYNDKLCSIEVESENRAKLDQFVQDELDFELVTFLGETGYMYDEDGIVGTYQLGDDEINFVFDEYCDPETKQEIQQMRIMLNSIK